MDKLCTKLCTNLWHQNFLILYISIYKKWQCQRNSKFVLFNSFCFHLLFFFFFQIWLVNWPIEDAFYFLFFYIHMSYSKKKVSMPKKQWIWFIKLFPLSLTFFFFHFQIWLVNWPIENAFYFLFFYMHISYSKNIKY